MRKILLMISFLLAGLASQAQIAEQPRAFSAGLVDSLRQVEAYQYGEAPEESSSLPSQVQQEPSEEKQTTGQFVKWLIYLLLGGMLLVVAIVVIRQFSGTSGKQLDRSSGLPIETEEALTQSDFQSLSAGAEASGNWRLAFRYRYLWALQQLQANNQIIWHPYKTDSDYLGEISNADQKAAFEPLMQAYSFIWYGQKEISQQQYQRLLPSFTAFA